MEHGPECRIGDDKEADNQWFAVSSGPAAARVDGRFGCCSTPIAVAKHSQPLCSATGSAAAAAAGPGREMGRVVGVLYDANRKWLCLDASRFAENAGFPPMRCL